MQNIIYIFAMSSLEKKKIETDCCSSRWGV